MGLHCFPYILLEIFMSLNACLDIKWLYIVFLSYFWKYSCPLMHAWILNGLSLYSFYTFGIIHVSLMHAQILNGFTLFFFHTMKSFMSLNACMDINWAYIVFLSYFWNYSCPLMHA